MKERKRTSEASPRTVISAQAAVLVIPAEAAVFVIPAEVGIQQRTGF